MENGRLETCRDGVMAIYIGFGLCTVVAAIWFVPDSRIEKKLYHEQI